MKNNTKKKGLIILIMIQPLIYFNENYYSFLATSTCS